MAQRLEIQAVLDAAGVKSGAASVESALGGLKSAAVQVGAALGVAFGVQGITQYAVKAVREFEAEALAMKRLEVQLGMLGVSYEDNARSLQELFTEIQAVSRYTDDEAAQAFQQLAFMTGDFDAALRLLPLAVDLASTGVTDLSGAVGALAKANEGVTRGLTMLVPALRKSKDPLADLSELIGGSAARNMDEFTARSDKLKDALGDLAESVGSRLESWLTPLREGLTEAARAAKDLTDNLPKALPGTSEDVYNMFGIERSGGKAYVSERSARKLSVEGMDFKAGVYLEDKLDQLLIKRMNILGENPTIVIGKPMFLEVYRTADEIIAGQLSRAGVPMPTGYAPSFQGRGGESGLGSLRSLINEGTTDLGMLNDRSRGFGDQRGWQDDLKKKNDELLQAERDRYRELVSVSSTAFNTIFHSIRNGGQNLAGQLAELFTEFVFRKVSEALAKEVVFGLAKLI